MPTDKILIAQTQNWIRQVVVGCNFCPFAKKELLRGSIHYEVVREVGLENCLAAVVQECRRLDENEVIETTFLLFGNDFADFHSFLNLIDAADEMIVEQGYEGIYQIASFHPDYRFADSPADDPANFTNRSIYPMLHLLREEQVSRAVDSYPDAEKIPERNMKFARKKGLAQMKALWEASRVI